MSSPCHREPSETFQAEYKFLFLLAFPSSGGISSSVYVCLVLFIYFSLYAWPGFGLIGGTYHTKTLESLVILLQSLLRITAFTRF